MSLAMLCNVKHIATARDSTREGFEKCSDRSLATRGCAVTGGVRSRRVPKG